MPQPVTAETSQFLFQASKPADYSLKHLTEMVNGLKSPIAHQLLIYNFFQIVPNSWRSNKRQTDPHHAKNF
jgi:hypothetical protein